MVGTRGTGERKTTAAVSATATTSSSKGSNKQSASNSSNTTRSSRSKRLEKLREDMETPTLADLNIDDTTSSPPPLKDNGKKKAKKEVAEVDNPRQPGQVYLFGSGDCGQLGMGEEVDSRKRPTLHPYFKDKQIVEVCAGGLHNLALSADGKVYSWGCNDEKALGHTCPEYSVGPVEGLDNLKIVQIACGDSISAALTDSGHVYAWGTFRDSRGVLGFDEKTEFQIVPKRIESLVKYKVVAIAAGANHLTALTSNDKIYSWGCGEQGQLGRRILERHRMKGLKPASVTLSSRRKVNSKYVKIVCGSYHTLALNQTNNVFVWGLNNYGQLGLGDRKERLNAELISPNYFNDEAVVDLGAGEHHSIVLTSDGNVYSFGRGDSGQLGVKGSEVKAVRVRELQEKRALASKRKKRRITGDDDDEDDNNDSSQPASSQSTNNEDDGDEGDEKDKDDDEGENNGDGDGDDEEAPEFSSRPVRVSSLSQVELIATGGNHNLALSSSSSSSPTPAKKIYSWGYGGMLQLGTGEEEDVSIPVPINFDLSINKRKILQLQGGGQHSALLVEEEITK